MGNYRRALGNNLEFLIKTLEPEQLKNSSQPVVDAGYYTSPLSTATPLISS